MHTNRKDTFDTKGSGRLRLGTKRLRPLSCLRERHLSRSLFPTRLLQYRSQCLPPCLSLQSETRRQYAATKGRWQEKGVRETRGQVAVQSHLIYRPIVSLDLWRGWHKTAAAATRMPQLGAGRGLRLFTCTPSVIYIYMLPGVCSQYLPM